MDRLRTNRLDLIVHRQRKSRTRDLLFACFVMLAAATGASSVGPAVQAGLVQLVQR